MSSCVYHLPFVAKEKGNELRGVLDQRGISVLR